jgi:hypothetical protein
MARPLARNSAPVSTIECGDLLPSSFSSTSMVSSEDTRIREDGKNTGPDGDLTEGATRAGGVEAAEVNPDSEKAEKEQRRVGLRPAGMQVRRKGLPVSRCSAPLLYAGPHDNRSTGKSMRSQG